MFLVHTTRDKFQNAAITCHLILEFVFEESLGRKSRDYLDVIIFDKLRCQNVFLPQENTNPTFSNSSAGLKSIFNERDFRDGLVWTVDLTIKIKPEF